MIHYHGGPITPFPAACEAWRRGHAMVSVAYPAQIALAAEIAQSFVIDNGAFTAWKRGVKPDWVEYAATIREWCLHPAFDWCIIPDVIDGSESDNDELLEWWCRQDDGRYGVPVWHLHESLPRLVALASRFSRVALGSSGEFADPGSGTWWNRMSEAMDAVCDSDGRPYTKLHGLRMLDPTIFSHIPLASADSTNIGQNVGIDKKWSGPYPPLTKECRAAVMADRIEFHASASYWSRSVGIQKNLGLIG